MKIVWFLKIINSPSNYEVAWKGSVNLCMKSSYICSHLFWVLWSSFFVASFFSLWLSSVFFFVCLVAVVSWVFLCFSAIWLHSLCHFWILLMSQSFAGVFFETYDAYCAALCLHYEVFQDCDAVQVYKDWCFSIAWCVLSCFLWCFSISIAASMFQINVLAVFVKV